MSFGRDLQDEHGKKTYSSGHVNPIKKTAISFRLRYRNTLNEFAAALK